MAVGDTERFKNLNEQSERRELRASSRTCRRFLFFLAIPALSAFTSCWGVFAAAITDAVQGLLILIMSLMLIPVGLHRIGGFAGLHRIVPEYLSAPFLRPNGIPFWRSRLAAWFRSSDCFTHVHGGISQGEKTARFGMISGGFTKRLVLIAWTLCGLIGLAVLTGHARISDANNTWGRCRASCWPRV